MAAGDLTNLTDVKAYLKIAPSVGTYDTFLNGLITNVSRRIERDCGRVFSQANYIEFWNTGTRQNRVQVRNKPIQQVNSVRWGVNTAIQLTYTGSAVNATITIINNNKAILRTIDASGTHDDVIDISIATGLPLCSQFVSAINAVSGFNASLMGGVDIPTRWLNSMSGITLKTQNAAYTQNINWPYIDIFSYYVDYTYGTIGFQPLTSLDYFFAPDAGAVTPLSFPGMYQGLCIDYVGGYSPIPGDVQLVAQQITADVFNQSLHDNNVQQESLDDYSYQLIDPFLRRQVYADMLSPYKTIPLAGGIG